MFLYLSVPAHLSANSPKRTVERCDKELGEFGVTPRLSKTPVKVASVTENSSVSFRVSGLQY